MDGEEEEETALGILNSRVRYRGTVERNALRFFFDVYLLATPLVISWI